MKKIDKLLQIKKANILAEQRYFESKGLIKEEDGNLSPKEKQILVDILGEVHSLDESSFDSVLDKVKYYAKKGMLTIGIVSTLLATPNITSAQSAQIKNVAKTEMGVEKDNKYDINFMSNTQVFNIVIMLIKKAPTQASEWVKANDKDGDMLYMLIENVANGKDMTNNADYYGGRLKTDIIQKFVNDMTGTGTNSPSGAFVGGFGNR